MMNTINKTPPDQRKPLVVAFFNKLPEAAGMPLTSIEVGEIKGRGDKDALTGGQVIHYPHTKSSTLTMNERSYARDRIVWETEIASSFHEQGHVVQNMLIDEVLSSTFSEDVGHLRRGEATRVDAAVSNDLYAANPLELHSQKFEGIGFGVLEAWKQKTK